MSTAQEKKAQMTNEEMCAHVKLLASKNGILLRMENPKGGKAYPFANPMRVVTQPIRSQTSYAIALHELGHCLSPEAREEAKKNGNQLLCEAEAWAWAMKRAKVDFTGPSKRAIGRYLSSYHKKWEAAAKRASGMMKVAFPPSESVYWEIIEWANPPEKKARFLP